jgi:hypothetical protein
MKIYREYSKKSRKFSDMLGIVNNSFKPTVVQKFSRLKVYYTLAFLVLLYGCDIRTLIKRMEKLTSIDMTVFRRTTGYILCNHKRMKIFWKS